MILSGQSMNQNLIYQVEADELTYPLHIIIRYEIEKAIFSNEVSVEDLPSLWNQKYQDYLGITPQTDAEGIYRTSIGQVEISATSHPMRSATCMRLS